MISKKQQIHILVRVLVVILLALSVVIHPYFQIRSEIIQLALLLVAGLISGLYYGKHNREFWGDKAADATKDPAYKIHEYWVHIMGGLTGALSLFLLLQDFGLSLTWSRLALFIIFLLGFTGLIPRALWFYKKD